MRDEYTRSRFMERIAAMQVARLVAPKIARINIRARHCHSVNFPRCWLYRVRKEERGWCSYQRNTGWRERGGRGWTEGKTQISLPPSMEFYALRAFGCNAHVLPQPHFRCTPVHPSRLTLTRHLDGTTGNTTDKRTNIHIPSRIDIHACTYAHLWVHKRMNELKKI